MINITFDNIDIHNFQSIGDAKLSLSQRGIVTVVGVNNYEANASSNGSGKSSIFCALFWCIYGKTPEGISDPTNRYTSGNCHVSLSFDVDGAHYTISREVNKSTQRVTIYRDDADISPRNKRDSDAFIRDSIIKLSSELFLSLVYLSQGFASRLSSLPPAARKDRLEAITSTSENMSLFDNQFKNYYNAVFEDKQNHSRRDAEIGGKCSVLIDSIDKWQGEINAISSQMDFFEYRDKRYTTLDIESLSVELQELVKSDNEYQIKIAQLQPERSAQLQTRLHITNNLQSEESRKRQLISSIDSLAVDNVCPTCGSHLNADKQAELESNYKEQLIQCEAVIAQLSQESITIEGALKAIDQESQIVTTNRRALSDKIAAIRYILDNIPKPIDDNSKELQANIDSYRCQLEDLKSQRLDINKIIVTLDNKLAVLQHCRQLISKQFRSYMLDSTVAFLNSRLAAYSAMLFSNESDVVRMGADSVKLDIFCGDAIYDSLSGGERRKVDIAVMLAQRDLSSHLAGMSCNILILDEVLESLDESATQVCLSLLEQQSQNVDSMFIISHNNYALPVDSTIVVTKGADHIASVFSE